MHPFKSWLHFWLESNQKKKKEIDDFFPGHFSLWKCRMLQQPVLQSEDKTVKSSGRALRHLWRKNPMQSSEIPPWMPSPPQDRVCRKTASFSPLCLSFLCWFCKPVGINKRKSSRARVHFLPSHHSTPAPPQYHNLKPPSAVTGCFQKQNKKKSSCKSPWTVNSKK